jgi:hypothetical protein
VSIRIPLGLKHHMDAVEETALLSGSTIELIEEELQWFSVDSETAQTLLDCIAENACELSVWSERHEMFITWRVCTLATSYKDPTISIHTPISLLFMCTETSFIILKS